MNLQERINKVKEMQDKKDNSIAIAIIAVCLIVIVFILV